MKVLNGFHLNMRSLGACLDESPRSQTEIIENLELGLARLSKEFPWVTRKVVQIGEEFSITAAKTSLELVVKELQDDVTVPTWDELREAGFPFRMLDEDVVAPCKTMVEPYSERPVLLVQANFVKGGLLLTFNAQHGSMDMAGQAQVITLFAKACRSEAFTKDEVETSNMRRTDRIPIAVDKTSGYSDSPKPKSEGLVQDVEANAKPREPQLSTPSDDLVWAYLDLSAASLSSLKKLASQTLTAGVSFVSTDDVLTAFIWQSITRARHSRLDSPRSTPTTLTRNVDVRRHFDLPPTYPGLMTTATSHTYPVDDLVNQKSLGAVASGLRAALSPDSLRNSAVVQATAISRNKGAAAQRRIAALSNPSFDVRLSSWAKEKLYDLDFGPCLGQPEAVRRPRFVNGAREGLVYFLPKGRDGSIVVGICLREEDMECLRMDGEVIQWSKWIG
ncbi:hypothetical protein INS49_013373 [Diaporthe citri]|uniref:uncharacterized protein n=1 Tax=Diaporthe citri TaxID=83186 RepID=UPI001C7E1F19|nr:uncharacterized protein INS49_013373 [Diaporthe citri]KAG6357496.1 hypothetical protein INS49_013373 [Diaporthe citri]